MSHTSKYYLPESIERTERKLAQLHLRREIAIIDQQLKKLEQLRSLYPSHRADDEQPCALHTAALP